MAIQKLYPPQLNGSLPAFYKSYNDDNGKLLGASITIPFGLNQAVSPAEVCGIALKLRTASTNSYIISNEITRVFNIDETWATFNIKDLNIAKNLNESQYYRAQIAFVDADDTIGYYSTVGIIKCVAKPEIVAIDKYEDDKINSLTTEVIGVYKQDTSFGDSTEKVYSYIFNIWDDQGNIVITSGEQLHDTTQDTDSASSQDTFYVYKELDYGKLYKLQYTVTTLNGLVISSSRYRVMRLLSVDSEYALKLHGKMYPDNGYIGLSLEGAIVERDLYEDTYVAVNSYDEYNPEVQYYYFDNVGFPRLITTEEDWHNLLIANNVYVKQKVSVKGEEACNGTFLITRASEKDNFFEWQSICKISLNQDFPSEYPIIKDYTVEQGVSYKYAIQQYNINDIYSNKIYISDEKTGEENITITANFEDMFLYDGERQLKIRFNPIMNSFKNTIPEQKIETIGSKYPFFFRNGVVQYKEFPIGGLISYQMDDSISFFNKLELEQIGVIENDYLRIASNKDGYKSPNGIERNIDIIYIKTPVFDTYTGAVIGYKYVEIIIRKVKDNIIYISNANTAQTYYTTGDRLDSYSVSSNTDLTNENIMAERIFKLAVLDWLSNGKVKLFRSPTEGNYLVRLLKTQLKPEKKLGRMIHSFTSTAYEIDDITYDKLIYYNIIKVITPNIYETHWGSYNVTDILTETAENGYYKIPLDSTTITSLDITNFAPGDELKIKYNDVGEDEEINCQIGITGSLNLNNDARTISELWLKPNPDVNYDDFSRNIIYTYIGLRTSWFDTIADVDVNTEIAQQFIGPKENLFNTINLKDLAYGTVDEYGLITHKFTAVEGHNNIKKALLNNDAINININNAAEKIRGLKIDILHVQKRKLIPIFTYVTGSNGQIISSSKFALTPFNKGYVNNKEILQYLTTNKKNIKYASNKYLTISPYSISGGVNINDIYTVLTADGATIDYGSILKPFVYNSTLKEWLPVTSGNYQYFDTYTGKWWEPTEVYDPTFSINQKENFDDSVTGDNNISLISTDEITLYNLDKVNKLRLGNGVMAEVTIELMTTTYDIETTNDNLRQAKKEYEDSKDNFQERLEIVLLRAVEIRDALVKSEELTRKIEAVSRQIELYDESLGAVEGVKDISIEQMILQKQNLYTNLINKIKNFITLLQNIQVPISLVNGTGQMVKFLNQVTESDTPQNSFGPDREITNRNLQLYKYTQYDNPDIINEFEYIYPNQQQYIIEKYTNENELLNSIINGAKAEIGQLSGTYDNLVNDGSYSEGTIAYCKSQIEILQQNIENLTEEHNSNIINLLNNLITAIMQNVSNGNIVASKEYLKLAEDYIRNNALALQEYITKLITIRNNELTALKNKFNGEIGSFLTEFNTYNDPDTSWDELSEEDKILAQSWVTIINNITDSPSNITGWVDQHINRLLSINDLYSSKQTNDNGWRDHGWNSTTNTANTSDQNKEFHIRINNLKENDIIYLGKVSTMKSICALSNNNSISTTDDNPDDPIVLTKYNATNVEKYTVPKEVASIIITVTNKIAVYESDYVIDHSLNYLSLLPENLPSDNDKINYAYYKLMNIYNNYIKEVYDKLDKALESLENIRSSITTKDTYNTTKFSETYKTIGTKKYLVATLIAQENNRRYYFGYNTELKTLCQNYNTAFQKYITLLNQSQAEVSDTNTLLAIKQLLIQDLLYSIPTVANLVAAKTAAYNNVKNVIENKITSYNNDLAIINEVLVSPGTYERMYSIEGVQQNLEEEENAKNIFVDQIEKERLRHISEVISELRKESVISSLDASILNTISEMQVDKLLPFLTDKYNLTQSKDIKTLVKKYTPQEIEDIVTKIKDEITQANANYTSILETYTNQINEYTEAQQALEARIAEITRILEQNETQYRENLDKIEEAQALLERYNRYPSEILDREELPEYIIESSKIDENINILIDYVNWALSKVNALKNQIGDLYSGVTSTEEYSKQLLELINAYEMEAYEFLHHFDTVKEDLEAGYGGFGGIDEKYDNIDYYSIYDYKDILYLDEQDSNKKLKNLTQDEINFLYSRDLTLVEGEESITKNTLYNKLQKILLQRLTFAEDDDTDMTIQPVDPNAPKIPDTYGVFLFNEKPYLVGIDPASKDKYYPDPYWMDDLSVIIDDDDNKKLNLKANYQVNTLQVPPTITNITGDWVRDTNDLYTREIRTYPVGTVYNNKTTYYTGTGLDSLKVYKYTSTKAWEQDLQAGKIKWLTAPKVFTFTLTPYTMLYKKLYWKPNFAQKKSLGSEQYRFVPYQKDGKDLVSIFASSSETLLASNHLKDEYYDYWHTLSGAIIYDIDEDDNEIGSLSYLYTLEKQLRVALLNYLNNATTQTYFQINNENYNDYLEAQRRIQQYEQQLAYWQNIKNECQMVWENWDVNKNKDDTTEKRKLEQLIATANKKINDLTTEYNAYLITYKDMFATFLASYEVMNQSTVEAQKTYKNLITQINDCYTEYFYKVNHYLQLIFNLSLDTALEIEVTPRTLPDSLSHTYNYGLAVAIDKYKENKRLTNQPLNFADTLEHIEEVLDKLEVHLEVYKLVPSGSQWQQNTRYFIKDKNDHYYDYEYNSSWANDVSNKLIYTSSAPELLDLIDEEYEESNSYDANKSYFILLEDNTYQKVTISNLTAWQNYTVPLYVRKTNGGLFNLFKKLQKDNPYIQNFITVYQETLVLYQALLDQETGADTSREALQNLLETYQLQLAELEELTKYANELTVDEAYYYNLILDKLVEYFRILTITYVDQIERRYEVV